MNQASKPILLHIPHSSVHIPEADGWEWLVDKAALQCEVQVMTDHFTDELFESPRTDRLVANVSRLVVDVERFRDDALEPMAEKGMGAAYTKTHDGQEFKLVYDREAILRQFYDPHHEALENWVDAALTQHGACFIIDCHSFPNKALTCDLDQSPNRPDFCIGTDAFHTPDVLTICAVDFLAKAGHSLWVNKPYAGSIVPLSRYQKDVRVASIMVEVNRRLYMDERDGTKQCFADVTGVVGELLERLSAQMSRIQN